MDETKDTKGLSSETPGQASKGSEGTTPKKEAKTYTEEEKQKAVSDELAVKGRDAKTLTDREVAIKAQEEAINARQAEIDEQERQRDAAELAAAKGDPELLRVYQDKQSQKREVAGITAQKADIKKQQTELDRSKAEHAAEITAAKEAQKEINIWQVASAKNIDPMRLKTLSEKFNVEGKEKLEELAEEIASGGPEPAEKKKTPDSLVTSGGKGSSEGKTSRQIYAGIFRDKDKK